MGIDMGQVFIGFQMVIIILGHGQKGLKMVNAHFIQQEVNAHLLEKKAHSQRFRDPERNVSRTYSEKFTFSSFFRESGCITSRRIPPDDDYTLGDSTREFSTSERTEMFSHMSDEVARRYILCNLFILV